MVLQYSMTPAFQIISIFGYNKQKAQLMCLSVCLSEIVADIILHVNPFCVHS